MVDQLVDNSNKYLAEQEMFKSLRDLLTVKVTLPLGNPNYKLIHTNSFIWLDLSKYLENISNFKVIADAMNSTMTRWVKYQENRWYVEAVTINEDQGGNKGTMELTLNPFPSSLTKYRDDFHSFTKAYQDAINQKNNSTNTATVSTGNSTLKGGQGETIDNLVKQICGNITDELQRCKAIYEWLRKNVIYSGYNCCKYSCGGNPTKAYENRNHLNCADTAVLTCAMMLSAGLNAYIVHRTYNGGHFWTIIEIGGKRYASDQTGRESAGMSGSEFNTVWSNSKRANTNPLEYSHKESGFNTC